MFLRRCKTDLISQRGAALVVALLVFALAAALMVGLQRDFTLQLQRTSNVLWGEQMWAYLRGAESLAIQALRYDQQLDAQSESPRDTLLELWAGPPTPYALDEGSMQGALTDLQGRFNVNALVKQERLAPQEPDEPADAIPADAADGIEQSAGTSAALGSPAYTIEQKVFIRLLQSLEGVVISTQQAKEITEAVSDFLDPDGDRRPLGAEDEAYRSAAMPYRAADRPIASVSELRAISGMTSEIYRALAPHISVWPVDGSWSLNILTAPPPLLRTLVADDSLEPLPLDSVVPLLERRESGDIDSLQALVEDPVIVDTEMPQLLQILDERSAWFLMEAVVNIADRQRTLYSVLHREGQQITPVFRTEGEL